MRLLLLPVRPPPPAGEGWVGGHVSAPHGHCEPRRVKSTDLTLRGEATPPRAREPPVQALIPLKREIASGAARPRNDNRGRERCLYALTLPQRETLRSQRQDFARIEPPFRIKACFDGALDGDLCVTQRLPHKRSFERADAVFAR